jgi:hypothetical protein
MYLKVQIPYIYSLAKSPADPTMWDVIPHKAKVQDKHHLFCDLQSYQTPWSQLNKKGEVYAIDNAHTLYPAYRKTSKIRPKMLPSSGYIALFNLHRLGGLVRYGMGRSEDVDGVNLVSWDSLDNSEAERIYGANLKEFAGDIYEKVYERFFIARTKPLSKFMEWVGTQKDIVGVWNANAVLTDRVATVGGVNYSYTTPDGHQFPILTRAKMVLSEIPETTPLLISYDQRMWASVPYQSHPEFKQPRQPVPILYSYESDIQEMKSKLAHSDVSSHRKSRPRNTDFDPPILDWESVGFPKVAPVSTKALYARQPIHLQFTYKESGFIDKNHLTKDLDFLHDVMKESTNYYGWFRNLATPIDTGAKRVSNTRRVSGAIRSVSDMSQSRADFSSEGEVIGRTLHYQSTGKAYQFQIESDFGKTVNRHIHFPVGVVNESQSGPDWKTIRIPITKTAVMSGNSYYTNGQKLYPVKIGSPAGVDAVTTHPYGRIGDETLKATQQTPAVVLDTNSPLIGNIPHLDIDKAVNYPRLNYSAQTVDYTSNNHFPQKGLPSHIRGQHRFASRRPADKRMPHQDLKGMNLLHRIMNEYLIPNEVEFDSKGNPSECHITQGNRDDGTGISISRLAHFLAHDGLYFNWAVTSVPVKSGEAVRVSQDLSFQLKTLADLESALSNPNNPLNELSAYQLDGLRAYYKVKEETSLLGGNPEWEKYSVTFYINPQNDLSVLVTYPSFLMRHMDRQRWRDFLVPALHNAFLREILENEKYAGELLTSNQPLFFLNQIDRYSSSSGVISTISDHQFDNEITGNNPVNQKWDSQYFTKPFSAKTVFNDFCYDILHIKSGLTLSDPLNTLPFNLKRNKLTVKRPFSYTSIFPVVGKEVDFRVSVVTSQYYDVNDLQYSEGKNTKKRMTFSYSPVASYFVPQTPSEELPDNIPEKIFKPMNTNSRTFKVQRNREWGNMTKAKDYTTYSSIVLPFENINEEIIMNTVYDGMNHSSDMNPLTVLGGIQSGLDAKEDKTRLLMPYAKDQRIQDARSEGKRTKLLSNNLASWSLGVPTAFVPETYTLSGMELGLFNWPFGLD